MVTGVEEYFKILEELQKNNTTLPINIQSGEPIFDVDLNDRLIIVPPEFKKYIAVQRDHNIETIYFRVDRYFDTTDLSELTCVVQFTNARKESGIHLVSEKDLTTYSSDGKMILGWKLNRDITQYPGTVTYSLRFYKLDENKKFIYDLHTIPAIGIIAPGLDTLEDTNAEEDTKPVANLITDLINRVDYACGPEMNGMMKNNINEYFAENPVKEEIREYITNHQVVSDDQVDNAVHDYLTANPPTGGATNVQVEEAVNGYFERNDIDGKINELLVDTKEDVKNVKNDLSDITTSKYILFPEGANRIDNTKWVNGFLTSGTSISGASGNYRTTDYIDIHDAVSRHILLCRYSKDTVTNKRDCRYAFYSEDKSAIDYQISGYYIEIPQNAYYIRLSDDGQGNDGHLYDMAIVCDEEIYPTKYIEYAEAVDKNIVKVDGEKLEEQSVTADKIADGVIPDVRKTFYCGSTREYTKLKDVIEEAVKYHNSIVYVDAETFDLVEEFGQDYLDNYNGSYSIGIMLRNDIHVVFEQGAKVYFNYQGTNEKIHKLFSPFLSTASLKGGFILENAYVESTNCRYTVHDECGVNEIPYINRYKNCTFIHDSSNCSWGAHQAIGGGLGKNATIIVEDCYGHAEGSETFTWHNSSADEAESTVIIKGCYADVVRVSSYGSSTKKTRAFVSNCSLSSAPKVDESFSTPTVVNVEMKAWNNEMRI